MIFFSQDCFVLSTSTVSTKPTRMILCPLVISAPASNEIRKFQYPATMSIARNSRLGKTSQSHVGYYKQYLLTLQSGIVHEQPTLLHAKGLATSLEKRAAALESVVVIKQERKA